MLPHIHPNIPPVPEDVQVARQEVAQAERRLQHLTAAIDRLTLYRNFLRDDFIPPRKSLVAPITAVPDDILLQIFDTAISFGWRSQHALTGLSTPYILSVVCKNWRRLLSTYSRFWTHIPGPHFAHPIGQRHYLTLPLENIIAAQLERAGTRLLSVDLGHRISDWSRRALERVLDTSDRWHELKIADPSFPDIVSWDVDEEYDWPLVFPALERLELTSCDELAWEVFNPRSIPKLKFLLILCGSLPRLPPIEDSASLVGGMTCTNLTNLTLDCGVPRENPLSSRDILTLLTLFPNLVTLSLKVSLLPQPFKRPYPTMRLLKLKNFTFAAYVNLSGFCTFLRCLYLPSLENLTILPSRNLIFKNIYRMIQKSGCRIRSLTMEAGYGYKDDKGTIGLPSLLSLLGSLEELDLVNAIYQDALLFRVLSFLAWKPLGTRRRCPNLHTLTTTLRSEYDKGNEGLHTTPDVAHLVKVLISDFFRSRLSRHAPYQWRSAGPAKVVFKARKSRTVVTCVPSLKDATMEAFLHLKEVNFD